MEFINLCEKIIDKNNKDYDMELFWYGLKNLIKNYYSYMTDKDGIKFSFNADLLSNNLNRLQKEEKYEEIYDNIHTFFKEFLIRFIIHYEINEIQNTCYIFTWLKRYNKIKGDKKIELFHIYNKDKYFSKASEDEILIIKLRYIEYSINNQTDIKYIKLINDKKFRFLDELINNYYSNMFDFISLRFNLNDFFEHKEMKVKSPIKFSKLFIKN
jgi:hypothetical protein